ncbi:hypothetical protein NDU88_006555 [Pleurodeles waltl]|uniref:Uncharacterized protein n=1 Tax=Pleurodeles waltl TaxID=8319 RepID=A0AAV7VMA2_PLEWA|nr:hypothetical protein NDU88_006555 [Pleurodeles waltl]
MGSLTVPPNYRTLKLRGTGEEKTRRLGRDLAASAGEPVADPEAMGKNTKQRETAQETGGHSEDPVPSHKTAEPKEDARTHPWGT